MELTSIGRFVLASLAACCLATTALAQASSDAVWVGHVRAVGGLDSNGQFAITDQDVGVVDTGFIGSPVLPVLSLDSADPPSGPIGGCGATIVNGQDSCAGGCPAVTVSVPCPNGTDLKAEVPGTCGANVQLEPGEGGATDCACAWDMLVILQPNDCFGEVGSRPPGASVYWNMTQMQPIP